MLSFFKLNALIQFIALLIILVLMRLPAFLIGTPLLIPEFTWMLVGEQVSKGFTIYSEIYDNTAPLSVLVYWIIDSIFGRSALVYGILSLFLTAYHVIYFNTTLMNRDVFLKKNYLPGLFYVLFMNISFDYCTLSPALLATTFLLFALRNILKQLNKLNTGDDIFEIGLYISIAMLFYPPCALFILWAIASLLFFSGTNFRQISLCVFGFLFPLVIVSLYFYVQGNFEAYSKIYFSSLLSFKQYNLTDFRSLLATIILPFGIGILGFMSLFNATGFNNFQIRTQQSMIIWAIFGLLSVALMPFLAPMQFIIMVPCWSFFAVCFFSIYKNKLYAEFLFLVLLGTVLFINFQAVYFDSTELSFAQLNNLRVKTNKENFKNKRVLVLGNGIEEYKDNYTATPYLNWNMAKNELGDINNYQNVINVLNNFKKDTPEIIIDQENIVPNLFERLPYIGHNYKKIRAGVYEKIKVRQ